MIEARKENYKGSQYTSTRLRSKQAFLYGRLQVKKLIIYQANRECLLLLYFSFVLNFLLEKEHGLASAWFVSVNF